MSIKNFELDTANDLLREKLPIKTVNGQYPDETGNVVVPTRDVGDLVWSMLPKTDAELHLMDGSLFPPGGVYDGFVQKIKSLFVSQNPSLKWLPKEQIVLPTFSANTQNGITISDARGNTTNLQAIFNGTSAMVQIGLWTTYWINIDYAQNTLLSSYTIQADNSGSPEYPSAWVVNGSNDGETWEQIDSQSGITFSLNESKTFTVNSNKPYKQYRIVFSAGVLSSSNGELRKISFDAYSAIYGYEKGLFFTEEQWQACVAKYGSCGKFVYSDDGVRLPKVSDIVQGTTDASALGDLIEAGLPNITGYMKGGTYFGEYGGRDNTSSAWNWGAIYATAGSSSGGHDSAGTSIDLNIDASRSNPIYGNSDTVQPQSIKALLYIVVANATKTAVEVNIDNVVTDLNGIRSDIQNLVTRPYVTETWRDGTEWYRKWSDGWIEQGGLQLKGSTIGSGVKWTVTVTLNTEFSNTNYMILLTPTYGTESSIVSGHEDHTYGKETTSFSFCHYNRNSGTTQPDSIGMIWYACGY